MSSTIGSVLFIVPFGHPDSPANLGESQQRTKTISSGTDGAGTDTVQLSQAQRVLQLHDQGETVSQIAAGLDLSVAAVNGYLAIADAA
jgi:DNA-binding NarL/FixJ family response regulator